MLHASLEASWIELAHGARGLAQRGGALGPEVVTLCVGTLTGGTSTRWVGAGAAGCDGARRLATLVALLLVTRALLLRRRMGHGRLWRSAVPRHRLRKRPPTSGLRAECFRSRRPTHVRRRRVAGTEGLQCGRRGRVDLVVLELPAASAPSTATTRARPRSRAHAGPRRRPARRRRGRAAARRPQRVRPRSAPRRRAWASGRPVRRGGGLLRGDRGDQAEQRRRGGVVGGLAPARRSWSARSPARARGGRGRRRGGRPLRDRAGVHGRRRRWRAGARGGSAHDRRDPRGRRAASRRRRSPGPGLSARGARSARTGREVALDVRSGLMFFSVRRCGSSRRSPARRGRSSGSRRRAARRRSAGRRRGRRCRPPVRAPRRR